MKRHQKLNLWSLGLVLLSLVSLNITLNSGGWVWVLSTLALVVAATAFFLWSVQVEARSRRG